MTSLLSLGRRQQFSKCWILAFLLATVPCALNSQDSESEWVHDNYGAILDSVMPLKPQAGQYVTFRTYHVLFKERTEYYFRIGNDPKPSGPGLDELSAHARMPENISIHDQLVSLDHSGPSNNPATIASKLTILKFDATAKGCPAIGSQFRAFQNLRLDMPRFDVIVLDPEVYEFRIQTSEGDMDLSLTNEKSPIVRWALETRRLLESCRVSLQHQSRK